MSYDGKLLRLAHEKLEQAKRENEAMYDRRLAQVYSLRPAVAEIDMQLRRTMTRVVGLALSQGRDPEPEIEKVREENARLQAQRAALLKELGHSADYTDFAPLCPHCGDTGYTRQGAVCSCLDALYRKEQNKELSSLLGMAGGSFEDFRLDYYSDTPEDGSGISPRANMETVYRTCVSYARRFGKNSPNLFFCGGTGLGKTFLASCIAAEVSAAGHSVVYAPAFELLRSFEQERFSQQDAAGEETRRYLGCDLLIVDDLGTEFLTSFVVSALYHLINTRLTTGKKTIITSNLTQRELASRYSQQIASRLEGEYLPLRFTGEDVRLKKDI